MRVIKYILKKEDVSFKNSVEIMKIIKKNSLKTIEQIVLLTGTNKMAYPFKRYNSKLSHKKKLVVGKSSGPGKYCHKVNTAINKILSYYKSLLRDNFANSYLLEARCEKTSIAKRHFARAFGRSSPKRRERIDIIWHVLDRSNIPKKEESNPEETPVTVIN